jgi:hypothetical protein
MTQTLPNTDVNHDFDFLLGRWHVHHHKLMTRLQNSNDWVDFEATMEFLPALGGLGNTDQMISMDGTPIGMSLRFFNRAKQEWNIYWVSYSYGTMESPVTGTFSDGLGIFEGDDVYAGMPIRVRFVWSETRTDTPKWEQYFSIDNGQTWEKNWVMTFIRMPDPSA